MMMKTVIIYGIIVSNKPLAVLIDQALQTITDGENTSAATEELLEER